MAERLMSAIEEIHLIELDVTNEWDIVCESVAHKGNHKAEVAVIPKCRHPHMICRERLEYVRNVLGGAFCNTCDHYDSPDTWTVVPL